MTTTRHITSSEIKTFKTCRRKWWLGQHRGLRPRDRSATGTLQLGSRVHEALEAYYDPEAGGEDAAFAALDLRREENIEEFPDQIEDIEGEHELATIMVTGYFEWLAETGADQDFEVLAVEQEIETPMVMALHGTAYRLLGKLDRQVRRRSDGKRLFMDDKTVGSLSDKPQLAEIDGQMLLYTLISRMTGAEGERVDGGIYNMLRKVKRTSRANPPFYDRFDFSYNDTNLDTFFEEVLGTIEQIADAEHRLDQGAAHHRVVPKTEGRHCTYMCPFFDICPMFDDGSDAEYMVEQEFEVGDPLERYDMEDRA